MTGPVRSLLTAAEAAGLLRLSRRVIAQRAKDGLLPSVQLPGLTGAYLFDRTVIEELVREMATLESAS